MNGPNLARVRENFLHQCILVYIIIFPVSVPGIDASVLASAFHCTIFYFSILLILLAANKRRANWAVSKCSQTEIRIVVVLFIAPLVISYIGKLSIGHTPVAKDIFELYKPLNLIALLLVLKKFEFTFAMFKACVVVVWVFVVEKYTVHSLAGWIVQADHYDRLRFTGPFANPYDTAFFALLLLAYAVLNKMKLFWVAASAIPILLTQSRSVVFAMVIMLLLATIIKCVRIRTLVPLLAVAVGMFLILDLSYIVNAAKSFGNSHYLEMPNSLRIRFFQLEDWLNDFDWAELLYGGEFFHFENRIFENGLLLSIDRYGFLGIFQPLWPLLFLYYSRVGWRSLSILSVVFLVPSFTNNFFEQYKTMYLIVFVLKGFKSRSQRNV